MNDFDNLIIEMAEGIKALRLESAELKASATVVEPDLLQYKFVIDEQGWLPMGEYLLQIFDKGEARIAYRANSWDTWSPPHRADRLVE